MPIQKTNKELIALLETYFVRRGRVFPSMAAAPVAGTWAVGDIVLNNAPGIGLYIGWVCTVAPLTFRPFGLIA